MSIRRFALRLLLPSLLLPAAGCQIMLTDLDFDREEIIDCETGVLTSDDPNYHCLTGRAGVAPAYYGPAVDELWGAWDGARHGFCLDYRPDGTGTLAVRGEDGTVRTETFTWGVVVDVYGRAEAPPGYWAVYHQGITDERYRRLMYRRARLAFPRWVNLVHRPCPAELVTG